MIQCGLAVAVKAIRVSLFYMGNVTSWVEDREGEAGMGVYHLLSVWPISL